MKWRDRIRYNLVTLKYGIPSLRKLQSQMLVFHLGHDKIIGWENGLPVRGLLVPAEFSPAFVNSGARMFNSLKYGLRYPGLTTLAVTARCNCRCKHCAATVYPGKDLPGEVWKRVIEESIMLGVFTIVFEGGEPLLRRDLPELISHVDQEYAIPVIYTNGFLLEERIKELKRSGLNRVYVSIDFPDEKRHDEHRGLKGLFKKALKGIEAAKRERMLVGLSTFSSPERFSSGVLEEMMELGVKLGVNEIAVFDALPAGCLKERKDLKRRDREYERKLRGFMEEWWKREDVPGVWWYGHLRSFYGCGCPAGVTMFHVSNNGDVTPCDGVTMKFGSVLEEDLESIWIRMSRYGWKRREEKGPFCWLQDEE